MLKPHITKVSRGYHDSDYKETFIPSPFVYRIGGKYYARDYQAWKNDTIPLKLSLWGFVRINLRDGKYVKVVWPTDHKYFKLA